MKLAINTVRREFIQWMWLWILATVVITVLLQTAIGRSPTQERNGTRASQRTADPRNNSLGIIETKNVTLDDVLLLNRRGDYKDVIKVWQQLDIVRDRETWKHAGIGAAHLRLENLDEAIGRFTKAVEVDPTNAFAEYLLGRVCQGKSRQTPFWYENDDGSPFRLIVVDPTHSSEKLRQGWDRGKSLPHFKTLRFDKQAKQHFRRAVRLSANCDLDRTIEFVQPKLRLISRPADERPITIRDLLISLDEEDYVEKARLEVGERFVWEK